MQKKHTLLFGAHMSIAGKIEKAIERGESIGCTAIQIFTKSNRQWKAKQLTVDDIAAFKNAQKKSSIQSVVAHASYLINIGSDKKDIEKKSVESLIIELERCHELAIPYLILHPGSCGKNNEKICLEQISHNLNTVLHKTKNVATSILLENMAGQGSNICYTFEHIAQLINNSDDKKRVGVCFDTCHAFAAGYDFTTKEKYEALWNYFDKIIGIPRLKVIHINDSAKPFNSHIDRHANIGKGKLGLEPFRLLFNDPRFFDVPKILETPKKTLSDDKENMQTIFSLISSITKKSLKIKEQ